MLEIQRQEKIIESLKNSPYLSVEQLVKKVKSSPATVRRDLIKLENTNKLKRIRGGATLTEDPQGLEGTPFYINQTINQAAKWNIAKRAVELVEDGETILIDGGSTTFEMVSFLKEKELKIITCSMVIAESLYRNPNHRVILPGGEIYPEQNIILNPFESNPYKNYRASKVFLSVEGIGKDGITNSDSLIVQTKRNLMECGKEIILLADSKKFEQQGPLWLCDLSDVNTVITDSEITKTSKKLIDEAGVECIIV